MPVGPSVIVFSLIGFSPRVKSGTAGLGPTTAALAGGASSPPSGRPIARQSSKRYLVRGTREGAMIGQVLVMVMPVMV